MRRGEFGRIVRLGRDGAEPRPFGAFDRSFDFLGVDRRDLGDTVSFADAHAGLRRARAAMTAATTLAVRLVLVLTVGARLLIEKRLPVGDRNLVIVGVNFREGEEAVAIPAVVDESGLQRRFDARHLGQINIAAQRLLACRFEVELFDPITSEYDHPGLFRVGGVDNHLVGHVELSSGALALAHSPSRGGQGACAARLRGL